MLYIIRIVYFCRGGFSLEMKKDLEEKVAYYSKSL